MILQTSAGVLQDGWARTLAAPMTRMAIASLVVVGLALMLLKYSGLS